MADHYRLNFSWQGLKNNSNPLLTSPHPAYFTEAEVIGESETGYPIEVGKAKARWEYEDQILSAAAWDQLQDLISEAGYGQVYIQTRVNTIEAGHFSYQRFKGYMKRPEGEPTPPWRYREVAVEFFDLEEWNDAKEAGG